MARSTAPTLGVTGAPAAGKSTFCRALAGLGATVVDVDGLGHETLASPGVRDSVVREFGPGICSSSGELDRTALARRVFGDEVARLRLEAIVHPLVRVRIDDQIAAARRAGAALIVIDCALLFESGLDAICDETVAVESPDAQRLARARASHGWDEAELERRTIAQMPPAQKRARAGRVVVNDADEARLANEARAVFETVLRSPTGDATRRVHR